MSTAASSSLSGLFSKGSASYAKFRPEYPAALYDVILQQASLPARDLAVDIATGSGQAAKDFSKHFARVIALDHNADQLQHAGTFASRREQPKTLALKMELQTWPLLLKLCTGKEPSSQLKGQHRYGFTIHDLHQAGSISLPFIQKHAVY